MPLSNAAITVENLSNTYLLGHSSGGQGGYHDTFRDVVAREARYSARDRVILLHQNGRAVA